MIFISLSNCNAIPQEIWHWLKIFGSDGCKHLTFVEFIFSRKLIFFVLLSYKEVQSLLQKRYHYAMFNCFFMLGLFCWVDILTLGCIFTCHEPLNTYGRWQVSVPRWLKPALCCMHSKTVIFLAQNVCSVWFAPFTKRSYICPSDAIWLIFIVVQIFLSSFVDFSLFFFTGTLRRLSHSAY